MKSIITQSDIVKSVKITKQGATVQSDTVAKIFGKAHKQVLLKIRKEIEALVELNYSTNKYFIASNYVNSKGADYTRYELTRKGFDLIVLGFTGSKARIYKLWYIDEFHKKSDVIQKNKQIAYENNENPLWLEFRNQGKLIRSTLTDSINNNLLPQRIAENKEVNQFIPRYITSYTNLVYKILNITTPTGTSVNRDTLDLRVLFKVEELETKIATMIQQFTEEGLHYKDCYKAIKASLNTNT